jgi:3-hydroxyacyl-CoA dehydrogenase/enoyl-CoA hydratase/3-hydroxybutyryl-CoA epimerase
MAGFRADNLSVDLDGQEQIAHLRLDVPDHKHNVLNPRVFADLDAAFDRLAADSRVQLLVIASRKPSGFLAGADLEEFTKIKGPADATAFSGAGQRVFDKLAGLPMPSVALIHGPCVGGGLELALACDFRVVIDHPTTQLGFPELKLGILPGWGGTQRSPRVIGVERALQMILQSRMLDASEARRWGLADELLEAPPGDALPVLPPVLVARFRQQEKRRQEKVRLRTWRQRLLESTPLGRWLLFRGAERIVRRRVPDDMPAPFEAIQAVRVGLGKGMAAGLAYEREASGRLATTPACRNLVTLFFLMENSRKAPDEQADSAPPIRRVGVVGAGTMGAGIAQLAAVKGFEVVVQEINDAALAAGAEKIETLFRRLVERGRLSADEARKKLVAIGKTTSWEGFGDADLVIEAVVEDVAKKREVFRELERRIRADAILATNTSSLCVQDLQEGLAHPDRVGGLHFFNPVHKMPLVEVVQAAATRESVAKALARWAAALGKNPVLVRDSPGFIVNRVLMPYTNEAVVLARDGMPIEQIDRVMRRFGMPMGPMELLDQVGLDVAAHIARTMQPHVAHRFPPNTLFEEMIQKGWLGHKNNAGFYVYDGKKKNVNGAALAVVRGNAGTGAAPREAQERMVLLMVNEAAACLGEGLAADAGVIDLALVLGSGWAPHRGGPLRYADQRSPSEVVRTLEDLARRVGPRFEPCAELRRRAAASDPFYHLLESQPVSK